MDPLLICGVFLIGGAGGYYLGHQRAVEFLGPLIHKMSARITELEARQVQQVMADDEDGLIERVPEDQQVQILENWIRK